ncbi:MAG: DEAD/DEAH box helicase [Bacteroidia bacterium]|nr:DEAD/DEAH box helicase [Bacteroidia bacterium]
MKFEDFSLSVPLLRAIRDLGFIAPTPIQEQIIPLLFSEKTDLVALAQTGTGKTAAFGLPLLHYCEGNKGLNHIRGLILTPTRELCLQISNELKNFSKYLHDLKIEAVYGGTSIENQIRALKGAPEVVCATPGRLMDLFERKAIDLSAIEVLVLDEADEMLNMGFREDIEKIIQISNPKKNIWMFSATMPADVEKLAKRYLKHPQKIQAGSVNVTASAIEHHAYMVSPKEKFFVLKRILDYYPDSYGIIFCRTKTDTQKLSDELVQAGYSADALHGDLTQSQREWVMKRFRMKSVRMLVATDVAARGIDVGNLTHVIHYQLPENPEVYTHRSGRTARAGKSGISVALYSSRDAGKFREIQRVCKFKPIEKKIPSVNEILKKQAEYHFEQLLKNKKEQKENYLALLPEAMKEALHNIDKEDLVQFYLENVLDKLKKSYEGKPENLTQEITDGKGNSRKVVFRVNLGRWDGLDYAELKHKLSEWSRVEEKHFYVRELKNTFSYVEVRSQYADEILNLNKQKIKFNDRILKVEARDLYVDKTNFHKNQKHSTRYKREKSSVLT